MALFGAYIWFDCENPVSLIKKKKKSVETTINISLAHTHGERERESYFLLKTLWDCGYRESNSLLGAN